MERHTLARPFRQRLAVGRDRRFKPRRAALALAQARQHVAEIVLRPGPFERYLFARRQIQCGLINFDGVVQRSIVTEFFALRVIRIRHSKRLTPRRLRVEGHRPGRLLIKPRRLAVTQLQPGDPAALGQQRRSPTRPFLVLRSSLRQRGIEHLRSFGKGQFGRPRLRFGERPADRAGEILRPSGGLL